MSFRTSRRITELTYRSQEDEGLLEVTKIADVLLTYASWDVFDQWMEVLESLLSEDGFDDGVVDLLAGVLAQSMLFL